jgi:hypothetical protein
MYSYGLTTAKKVSTWLILVYRNVFDVRAITNVKFILRIDTM